MLELQNVGIDLMGKTIVEHFSMRVERGQCVVLSGASGCGKTTLLRVIANLIDTTEGKIINNFKRLSYLFQEPRLLPWLTAAENVCVVKPKMSFIELQEIFIALSLNQDDMEKFPHELSGGMQQRVALARALIQQPDLLLMDEPFSALDTRLREDLQWRIMRLIEEGLAVVLVTHDAQEAVRMAHNIYCLRGNPSRCVEEICLTENYVRRDLHWCLTKATHPILQGIEEEVLFD